jgi:hypothetical protein
MSAFSAIGLDVVLGLVTGIWFIVSGSTKLPGAPSAGRRSMPTAAWVLVLRRIRGAFELLGGLGLVSLSVLSFLKFDLPPIGFGVGVGLSALALWTAVESWVSPRRPVRIILSVVGFVLVVFFTGFRG